MVTIKGLFEIFFLLKKIFFHWEYISLLILATKVAERAKRAIIHFWNSIKNKYHPSKFSLCKIRCNRRLPSRASLKYFFLLKKIFFHWEYISLLILATKVAERAKRAIIQFWNSIKNEYRPSKFSFAKLGAIDGDHQGPLWNIFSA